MKYIVILVLTLITALLMKFAAKYRVVILCGFLCVLIGLNLRTSYYTSTKEVPAFQPVTQTLYQPEDIDHATYPDGFLALLTKGKTIHVANDFYHPVYDMNDPKVPWEHEMFTILRGINYDNLLRLWGANLVHEQSINGMALTEEQKADFENLGSANDMLRNSFAVNGITEEYGNYFHYYYIYYVICGTIPTYVNPEGLNESDEWVVFWEKWPGSMYLMTKDYYDREVAK